MLFPCTHRVLAPAIPATAPGSSEGASADQSSAGAATDSSSVPKPAPDPAPQTAPVTEPEHEHEAGESTTSQYLNNKSPRDGGSFFFSFGQDGDHP